MRERFRDPRRDTRLALRHGLFACISLRNIFASGQIDQGLAQPFRAAGREITCLSGLIDDVMEISRNRPETRQVKRAEFDLADLVREIADSLSTQAEEAHCIISVNLQPAIGRWDRSRLDRLLTSLIANAIKHSPGKDIAVRTYNTGGSARLVVEDPARGSRTDDLVAPRVLA